MQHLLASQNDPSSELSKQSSSVSHTYASGIQYPLSQVNVPTGQAGRNQIKTEQRLKLLYSTCICDGFVLTTFSCYLYVMNVVLESRHMYMGLALGRVVACLTGGHRMSTFTCA